MEWERGERERGKGERGVGGGGCGTYDKDRKDFRLERGTRNEMMIHKVFTLPQCEKRTDSTPNIAKTPSCPPPLPKDPFCAIVHLTRLRINAHAGIYTPRSTNTRAPTETTIHLLVFFTLVWVTC